LTNIQYIKLGAISTVVLLAIMLTTVDLSQSSAFAQNSTSTLNSAPITPAPETSDSDDDSSSDENGNDDSSDSSGSGDDGHDNSNDDGNDNNNDTQDTSSSDDESDSQEDTSSSEEEADETEDDLQQTNPLLEEIRNKVSGALSTSGMAVL